VTRAAALPSPGGEGSEPRRGSGVGWPSAAEVTIAAVTLNADPSGIVFWPEQSLLAVADLHLEKGSSFARRGVLLPPYDTAATLARLAAMLARYQPKTVVALGDNFHDGDGASRMADTDRAMLRGLQKGRDWVWITGNHDPEPMPGIGGVFAGSLALGSLLFRHEPSRDAAEGEIAGHLHPLACVAQRGRAVRRACFAADGKRMVMPAFGSYTGGLNIRDRAFAGLFDRTTFVAHMLGTKRIYAIAAARCLAD